MRVERTSDPGVWAAGVDLAMTCASAAGLDEVTWPAPTLEATLRARQARALSVWVAWAEDRLVGHALVLPVTPSDPIGQLLGSGASELGGLVVHPDWQGRGVARALRDARSASVSGLVVTATRPGALSNTWYARYWDFVGRCTGTFHPLVDIYRRP